MILRFPIKIFIISSIIFLTIILAGLIIPNNCYSPNFSIKNLSPSLNHFFGTDALGRDMFFRTLKGLSISTIIGVISALISVIIATVLGTVSGYFGGILDKIINWVIDLSLSIPHLMQLMLIAFVLGGGVKSVIIAISVSHWGTLTRVIRAEVLQLKTMPYIAVSQSFGKKSWWILANHIMPIILPQLFIGFIVIFPHAILHEASITFIGLGLPSDMPAIGTILAEAFKHLVNGHWWLMLFPGLCLLLVVMLFYRLSRYLMHSNNKYRGIES